MSCHTITCVGASNPTDWTCDRNIHTCIHREKHFNHYKGTTINDLGWGAGAEEIYVMNSLPWTPSVFFPRLEMALQIFFLPNKWHSNSPPPRPPTPQDINSRLLILKCQHHQNYTNVHLARLFWNIHCASKCNVPTIYSINLCIFTRHDIS